MIKFTIMRGKLTQYISFVPLKHLNKELHKLSRKRAKGDRVTIEKLEKDPNSFTATDYNILSLIKSFGCREAAVWLTSNI